MEALIGFIERNKKELIFNLVWAISVYLLVSIFIPLNFAIYASVYILMDIIQHHYNLKYKN